LVLPGALPSGIEFAHPHFAAPRPTLFAHVRLGGRRKRQGRRRQLTEPAAIALDSASAPAAASKGAEHMNLRRGYSILAAITVLLSGTVGHRVAIAGGGSTPPSDSARPGTASSRAPQAVVTGTPRNITIIESASGSPGMELQLRWQAVATAMGHDVTIADQTALDDVASLNGADVLIVSSGIIDIPANRAATIVQFLESHRPVYLQGEYLCTYYSTNVLFASIVNSHGGSYSPFGTVSGNLDPMQVLGNLAHEPNTVPSLPYFWYGCSGSGDASLEPFLAYQGGYFGFVFRAPGGSLGNLLMTTDQDWVLFSDAYPESVDLMENVLTFMTSDLPVPIVTRSWGQLKSAYR
jgi:hypothetical protein